MSESILSIVPVKRETAKVIIGLASTSGGGKTYTALELAYGLSGGQPSKIGFLDTETGRGALYDTIFGDPYMYAQLRAPFSPKRYSQALIEFSQAGMEVLVVDSMSHEYEGEGGVSDIAEEGILRGNKIKDWIKAKREHHRFMATLLAIPCHLVLCFRAREKTDFKSDPKNPTSLGIQPIAEKNAMYEMVVSFMLEDGGRRRTALKEVPKYFPFLQGSEGYLTREHGRQMREWFGAADQEEIARKSLSFAASQGTEKLKLAWEVLSPKMKRALETYKQTLKEVAQHADIETTVPPAEKPEGEEKRYQW